MAGLYAPLPTLRRRPRGRLRTDRGRRGLLLLHRSGLSPHTPCQSPGALTRVAASTLAWSPYIVTAIRRLQTLRLLHACSGRFRLERSPGGPCTHWKSAALSRRTQKADLTLYRDKGQQWHESTLRGRVIDDRTAPARLARAAGLFPAAAAGRPIWW